MSTLVGAAHRRHRLPADVEPGAGRRRAWPARGCHRARSWCCARARGCGPRWCRWRRCRCWSGCAPPAPSPTRWPTSGARRAPTPRRCSTTRSSLLVALARDDLLAVEGSEAARANAPRHRAGERCGPAEPARPGALPARRRGVAGPARRARHRPEP
nr:hypothetical protein [Angustibacter aerolatus]